MGSQYVVEVEKGNRMQETDTGSFEANTMVEVLPTTADFEAKVTAYRDHLFKAEQSAQGDYDKTLIYLSSGALGVSFAFLQNIVGTGPFGGVGFLLAAWFCWAASLSSVLASFLTSHFSLRMAIRQIDLGTFEEESVGGWYSKATVILNLLGGGLFVIGVVSLVIFAYVNLGVV